MNTISLDSENNIISTQTWQTKSDNEALIQDVRNRLSMFAGEYPFDTTQGVDYFNLLAMNRKSDLQNAIINEVLKDDRVKSVTISSFEWSGNQMLIGVDITNNDDEVLSV